MDGTDEILHGRLPGQADQVLDVVHDQPRQVLRVVQVLTLSGERNGPSLTPRQSGREQALTPERGARGRSTKIAQVWASRTQLVSEPRSPTLRSSLSRACRLPPRTAAKAVPRESPSGTWEPAVQLQGTPASGLARARVIRHLPQAAGTVSSVRTGGWPRAGTLHLRPACPLPGTSVAS